MKNTARILLIGFSLFLIGCHSRDDIYYLREVEITDAFVFENAENYVVGDTIFFDLNFSRYLEEEGYSNLLDIYETTGAEEFNYSFRFSKFSDFSNSYIPINIAEDFVFAEKGKVSGQSSAAKAVLNDTQTMYESRIGIILAETGDFNFDADYYSLNLYPENVREDKVYVEIRHRFSNSETDQFAFTVTE